MNAASGRVDKPGTTRLRRVAPTLPTLIHPLTTLRRTSPAASRGCLRRNHNKFFLKGRNNTVAYRKTLRGGFSMHGGFDLEQITAAHTNHSGLLRSNLSPASYLVLDRKVVSAFQIKRL